MRIWDLPTRLFHWVLVVLLFTSWLSEREDWMLKTNAKWHGFGNLAPGFNMLDPIKATLITAATPRASRGF